MTEKPWRERYEQEDALIMQLQGELHEAAIRRAQALADGVAETGSIYQVARYVGKSWTAVSNAIKKHTPTE